jgi:hypothetical protein
VRHGMEPDPQQPDGFRIQRKDASAEDAEAAKGPAVRLTGPTAPDRYCCAGCDEPIATERVIRIEAERSPARGVPRSTAGGARVPTGYMLITHVCACSSLALTSRRYRSYEAFVAMFGRGVSLPYEAPFRPAVVPDDDPSLLAWRWELQQTLDVDDFLYWLEHRRPA